VPVSSYKFGDFELDCARFELRRNGRPLKLERIPMELLILLAEKDGVVVTRQEIVERLWGKDVFVDTEHGINTAIRKIRTALREDAEHPRFVQTVLGKGYRFVTETVNGNATPVETTSEGKSAEPAGTVPAKRRRRWPAVVAVAVLLVLGGGLLELNVSGVRDRYLVRAHPEIRSIAVLPLANLSGDPAQDYYAEGMTDELITTLAKSTSLHVISRTSAMRYKGTGKPLREIAQELGVDGILEGSVTRSATDVHLTIQLIQAQSDTHIWANSYDRDIHEAFSLPSELSRTIANEVKIATSPASPTHYVSPEAHDAYLRGRFFWFAENYNRSLEYFQIAIQLQPDYAAAWSGLADAYAVRAVAGISPPDEIMGKAEAAARKAVELDDSLPEAHNSIAAVYFFLGWNWKSAERESLRAIELSPNYAEAHHLRSYILATMNRPDEALQEQRRSTELDPFARPWALGLVLIHMRQYDAAVNDLRLRAEAQPRDVIVHLTLSEAYRLKGMAKESAHELEERYVMDDDNNSAAAVRSAFERGGEESVAMWRLNHSKEQAKKNYISPWALAYAHARLGQRDTTLEFLERAFQEHSAPLVFLQNEPRFDFLHSDQRYRAIVQKMGLPPAY
jgi:TolB-like protein/DNA-binding winged helix-turn-helix (wHTH) protein